MPVKSLGPYTIEAELGSGGMGSVYRATLTEPALGLATGDTVALKVIHEQLLTRPGFFKRFLREAEVGRQVRHENVVRTYDVDAVVQDGKHFHYIVMEYVEGRTLRDLLAELGTLPESLLRAVARQIAAGLAAIHARDVVHRDLKPENVLVTGDHQVRIMDLGVARLQEATVAITREGQFAGSLLYAAPEQFEGGHVGPTTDLYSLGVALYELATGENPFQHDQPAAVIRAHLKHVPPRARERNSEVSAFFSEVVETLLQKQPEDRFATSVELCEVLDQAERSPWWESRETVVRERDRRLPTIHVRRETEIHGRDDDLATLRTAWKAAVEGNGSVALLEGEDGIGKTRLADAFVRSLEGEDVHVLYGSYPPSGGMGGVSDALVEKFGGAQLADGLRPYLAPVPSLVPTFAAMVKNEAPPTGAESLSSDALHTVFAHLLRGLAQEKPTLWIIDDLHFAPGESRQIQLALARATRDTSAMVLFTSAPGLEEDFVTHLSREPEFRRIALNRLSPREVVQLLRDAFRSEALADRLGAKIAFKSDGVPFFVFEMIRGLKEGQFITEQADGTYVATQVIDDIEVPSAVRDLVEARLRDLDDEDRSLVDVAAIQGYEFDPDLVGRVLEIKPIKVLQRFASLERKSGIVRGAGALCRFDHHQIQEVLCKAQLEGLRKEYHAALAEALFEREGLDAADPDDVDGELAVSVCKHAVRGTRPKIAAPLVLRAMRHLAGVYRYGLAAEIADLALAARGILSGKTRAEVLLARCGFPDLNPRPGDRERLLEEAESLAQDTGERALRAKAMRLRGHFLEPHDVEAALRVLAEAADLARAEGDWETESHAYTCRGVALSIGGDEDAAITEWRRALELLPDEAPARTRGVLLNNLGSAAAHRGDLAEALQRLDEGLRCESESAAGRRGLTLVNLSETTAVLGSEELHVQYAERAREAAARSADCRAEMFAHQALAVVAARAGDLEGALRRLETGLALRTQLRNPGEAAELLVTLGGLHRQRDDTDSARSALLEAFETAERGRQTEHALLAACNLATFVDGWIERARDLLAHEDAARSGVGVRMEAHFLFWQATGEREHLDEAHRTLMHLRDHAPEEYRESMLANVPLHRDIVAAWKEHGGSAD